MSRHNFTACKSKNLSRNLPVQLFISISCLIVGENLANRGILWLSNGKGGGLPGNTEAPLPTRLIYLNLWSFDEHVPPKQLYECYLALKQCQPRTNAAAGTKTKGHVAHLRSLCLLLSSEPVQNAIYSYSYIRKCFVKERIHYS